MLTAFASSFTTLFSFCKIFSCFCPCAELILSTFNSHLLQIIICFATTQSFYFLFALCFKYHSILCTQICFLFLSMLIFSQFYFYYYWPNNSRSLTLSKARFMHNASMLGSHYYYIYIYKHAGSYIQLKHLHCHQLNCAISPLTIPLACSEAMSVALETSHFGMSALTYNACETRSNHACATHSNYACVILSNNVCTTRPNKT